MRFNVLHPTIALKVVYDMFLVEICSNPSFMRYFENGGSIC
jgi:hypothetical protein